MKNVLILKKMNNKRYKELYEEGSELLWPSEEEDKITRNFYRDLSHFSKSVTYDQKKKLTIVQQLFRILIGKGGSTIIQK